MGTLHELRPQRKRGGPSRYSHELPKMVETIEHEWQRQRTVGPYRSRKRLLLRQAHIALACLREMEEEAI
jgi:hypothetical protein